MKPFHLEPGMKTLRGVFYPTGWMVLMLPGADAAREAARRLEQAGLSGEGMMLASPDELRRELGGAEGDDNLLPSAGTEGDTVRKLLQLSREGHHALMVHAPHHEDSDRVMQVLEGAPIAYGQKYRALVIEDVVA